MQTTTRLLQRGAFLVEVAKFMTVLFEEDKHVNTIKNYHSAIVALHSRFPDMTTVGLNGVPIPAAFGNGEL